MCEGGAECVREGISVKNVIRDECEGGDDCEGGKRGKEGTMKEGTSVREGRV